MEYTTGVEDIGILPIFKNRRITMILVSACLAGVPCRYNGENKLNKDVRQLVKDGEAIFVCPEQLGGLTTPRLPAEIINGRVVDKAGKDVTMEFRKGAEIVLELARNYKCKKAILKARSPSCGKGEIYDGSFTGTLIEGNGITADVLLRNGIKVIDEDDI